MKHWKTATGYGVFYGALAVGVILLNVAAFVFAIWLAVKVLQWMGVL